MRIFQQGSKGQMCALLEFHCSCAYLVRTLDSLLSCVICAVIAINRGIYYFGTWDGITQYAVPLTLPSI